MGEQVKIIMLGNSGAGKTCIINRLVSNKFESNTISTTAAAMSPLTVKIPETNAQIRCQIWDTAGQEEYRSIASMYYKDAKATIVVFDLTKKDSFEGAKWWIQDLKEKKGEDIVIILTGNKADLIEEQTVDLDKARDFADSIGVPFVIVSAKEDMNMKEILDCIGTKLREKKLVKTDEGESSQTMSKSKDEPEEKSTKLTSGDKSNKSNKCC